MFSRYAEDPFLRGRTYYLIKGKQMELVGAYRSWEDARKVRDAMDNEDDYDIMDRAEYFDRLELLLYYYGAVALKLPSDSARIILDELRKLSEQTKEVEADG